MRLIRTVKNIAALTWMLFALIPGLQAISEPIHTEPAWSADAFVDSIGVNTHLSYIDTSYSNYTALIKPRLIESGIRHIRDACPTPQQSEFQQRLVDLGNCGIRSLLICQPRTNLLAADFPAILQQLTVSVEMIEGPNETDLSGLLYKGFKFPAGTRAFQDELFAAVKGQPDLKRLPVLMSSVGNPENAFRLGSLLSADFANTHCYSAGTPPGFRWNWYADRALTNFLGPVIASECGYHNAVNQADKLWIRGISEKASGKYIPRLLAEHFLRGVRRTYLYEFIDERAMPEYSESNFGLLRCAGEPKPAFIGVKNLITLLADAGAPFAPASLDYGVNGEDIPVRHLLLQKRSGKFYLLLWLNSESFDVREKKDITVEPRTTRLIFGKAIRKAKVFAPLAGLMPLAEFGSSDELLLRVPDQLLVIEIEP